MATTLTYTDSGTKSRSPAKLDKTVFGLPVDDHGLVQTLYVAYLSNGRRNYAYAKTRGLIRGGGKKPWKQKGTGRARAGSSRSPLWRSGGVIFGPTGQENYTHKVHKSSKRLAIRQALSIKSHEGAIRVINSFESKDGKVKSTLNLLNKIDAIGSILIVLSKKDDNTIRATRNVPNLEIVQSKYLNVFNVLNADTIIFDKESLEIVHQWLGDKK